jgi:predicted DCC family thiol-disulfide oxidoreductase YuxK
MTAWSATDGKIILYDGVCNLCSRAVRFIIKRDPDKQFRFAALQSNAGHRMADAYDLTADQLETVALVNGDEVLFRSDAALAIARCLRGPVRLLVILRIVPRPIRDACYRFIANRRYRWFGRKTACEVPAERIQDRFLP